MNIVFRADASLAIGTGHIMRCLTLADALHVHGAQCYFVCKTHPGHMLDLIRQRGHVAIAIDTRMIDTNVSSTGNEELRLAHDAWLGGGWREDAEETLKAVAGLTVDWLIVDHYALDIRWEGMLRPTSHRLMVIDDLADRHHDCDLLLDQNWFGDETQQRYKSYVPEKCKCFLGPEYALLKPEYPQLRALMPPRDGVVRRLLVCLGGSDPTNETGKVLSALKLPEFKELAVDIVLGVNHSDSISIQGLAEGRPLTTVYQGLPSLAALMLRADLMIGAGGSTTWERMCLGLPAIVVSIADNQTPINQALGRANYIEFIGHMSTVNVETIVGAVRRCLETPTNLKARSVKSQELVPGNGISQISSVLLLECEK